MSAKEFTGIKRIKNMKNFAPLYPFGDNRAKAAQLCTILWITLDNFQAVIHSQKDRRRLAFWGLSPLSTALPLPLLIYIYFYYPMEVDEYAFFL
jgi:hypothetical protein